MSKLHRQGPEHRAAQVVTLTLFVVATLAIIGTERPIRLSPREMAESRGLNIGSNLVKRSCDAFDDGLVGCDTAGASCTTCSKPSYQVNGDGPGYSDPPDEGNIPGGCGVITAGICNGDFICVTAQNSMTYGNCNDPPYPPATQIIIAGPHGP